MPSSSRAVRKALSSRPKTGAFREMTFRISIIHLTRIRSCGRMDHISYVPPKHLLQCIHNSRGRLDIIGLAGFSHNFGALEGKHAEGKHASVTEVFDAFSASPRSMAFNKGIVLLAETFPFLMWLPTPRRKLLRKLSAVMEEISNVLLARTQKELEIGVVGGKEEKSLIGLLSN